MKSVLWIRKHYLLPHFTITISCILLAVVNVLYINHTPSLFIIFLILTFHQMVILYKNHVLELKHKYLRSHIDFISNIIDGAQYKINQITKMCSSNITYDLIELNNRLLNQNDPLENNKIIQYKKYVDNIKTTQIELDSIVEEKKANLNTVLDHSLYILNEVLNDIKSPMPIEYNTQDVFKNIFNSVDYLIEQFKIQSSFQINSCIFKTDKIILFKNTMVNLLKESIEVLQKQDLNNRLLQVNVQKHGNKINIEITDNAPKQTLRTIRKKDNTIRKYTHGEVLYQIQRNIESIDGIMKIDKELTNGTKFILVFPDEF